MFIYMVSSEAVPYIQTGGLGDVVGTLAKQLTLKGHKVTLVLPFYKSIKAREREFALKPLSKPLTVKMGNRSLESKIWRTSPETNLNIYFIEYNDFFDRNDLYGEAGEEYKDNGRRFAFFSKAALDLSIHLKVKPDVIHINDWQTSLIAYYLKTWFWKEPLFKNTASVLTIHNLGYQGHFPMSNSEFVGLNWMQMRSDEFEDNNGINPLKGGLFYADMITTVSPTYAKEILSEPGGCGLSDYLTRRQNDIVGILNGIDDQEWHCETDRFIPQTFSANDLSGKKLCKAALQKRFGLNPDPAVPVFGMVGRLAYQKGMQLLMGCLEDVMSWELQLVVLGSGNPFYAGYFENLQRYFPEKVGIYIGFQNELAHLIEAGSDFFIMPSLYEPCGLNQIYSMLYGSLPIVRATGGLADTVRNFDEETQSGTGFVFDDITSEALKNTIGWALSTWYDKPESYKTVQLSAMKQDFGWQTAVEKYETVYDQAMGRRKSWS
ncbi:MAG: glycogen synthase [Proteobacteria bacterium]|nr:glycogen synthase [Pseudomonadota bacterium]